MVSYQHKDFQQLFISIWSPCTVHRMGLFSLQKRCPWEFLTSTPGASWEDSKDIEAGPSQWSMAGEQEVVA